MGQPIKKRITEAHPEAVKEEPFTTLLVDGNSLLFACMADTKVNEDKIHYGGVFQFLLQLKIQMQKYEYDYVYVFFDNEFSGYLRWELYKPYKGNRDKHYEEYGQSEYMKELNANIKNMQKYLFNKNKKPKSEKTDKWEEFIDANFDRERDILMEIFEELYIRTYIDEVVEGDDLISYYCKNKKPNERIVIVSGDMDISQLISDDIVIYNLKNKKYIKPTNFINYFGYHHKNILIKKILCGDVSDNIGNIKGLSENGFFNLMPEAKEREITIDEVKNKCKNLIDERKKNKKKPLQVHENILNGVCNKQYDGDFYEINRKIIDLKNPLLTKECEEYMNNMMYAPIDPEGRSFSNVYRIICKNKIEELMSDTQFSSFFRIFKRLEEKEIKRYKDSIK